MFELTHLRCFIAVADELHFGRAAQRLNMTQPPLSRQIQILERVLGTPLLKRTSRSVQLTPAGKNFLREARQIVYLVERASRAVQKTSLGEFGSLGLGFTAASGYRFIPQLLGEIRQILPMVDLDLKEMVTDAQIDALIARQIDLGLLRPPIRSAELSSMPILREGLMIATPKAGIEGFATPRTLADFEGLPTITFAPQGARYFYDLLGGLFTARGVAPLYVHYIGQIHSILALVGAGRGAALVPEAALALHFDGVDLHPLPEVGKPVELSLVWRTDNDNPTLERLLANLVPSRLTDR